MTSPNALKVSDVARVAADAAREMSSTLSVLGTTIPGGGGHYVEVLVDIQRTRRPTRQLVIGVFRNVSESTLRSQIRRRLREQLSTTG